MNGLFGCMCNFGTIGMCHFEKISKFGCMDHLGIWVILGVWVNLGLSVI